MRKEIERSCIAMFAVSVFFIGMGACADKTTADASGPGFQYIGQTINSTVEELTEQVAEKYPICPELLQTMIFYESGNREDIRNAAGDTGYMQVNLKWHKDRMDRLGVTDLYDGYSNILVGADYLAELCGVHNDIVTALMVYHGEKDAVERAAAGEISEYARKILALSEGLERLHGK